MGPIRELGESIAKVAIEKIRKISLQDFAKALNAIKPSVNKETLQGFEQFTQEFGTA